MTGAHCMNDWACAATAVLPSASAAQATNERELVAFINTSI
jgi:hypothetical protein